MAVSSQRRPAGRLFFRRCAGCVHSPWERPWPRRGRCCPQASIQAAVGVRRPLPQNPARAPAAGLDHAPVGAALAATRPLLSAGFDPGRRRGQDPSHRTPARLSPRVWLTPCGSGLGRDTAAVVRRPRSRPLSGPEDPSHRTPHGLRPRVWRMPLWERRWPRHGPALRGPRCRPLSGSRPLPQNPARAPAAGLAHAPVGAALAATRPSRFGPGCCPGRKTSPTNPGAALIGLAARRRRARSG